MEKYLFYIKEKMAILYKRTDACMEQVSVLYVLNKGCFQMCISQLFS
ncbi:hypothetical protein B4079_4128 [Bacillus cereus]|nr:hypothetical protein B4079_4128 [Bacillus cereus]